LTHEEDGAQGNVESCQPPEVVDLGKGVDGDNDAMDVEVATFKGDDQGVGSGNDAWERAVQQDSASSGQKVRNNFAEVCFKCNEPGHFAYACKVGSLNVRGDNVQGGSGQDLSAFVAPVCATQVHE
jgi:hypothetical protein